MKTINLKFKNEVIVTLSYDFVMNTNLATLINDDNIEDKLIHIVQIGVVEGKLRSLLLKVIIDALKLFDSYYTGIRNNTLVNILSVNIIRQNGYNDTYYIHRRYYWIYRLRKFIEPYSRYIIEDEDWILGIQWLISITVSDVEFMLINPTLLSSMKTFLECCKRKHTQKFNSNKLRRNTSILNSLKNNINEGNNVFILRFIST